MNPSSYNKKILTESHKINFLKEELMKRASLFLMILGSFLLVSGVISANHANAQGKPVIIKGSHTGPPNHPWHISLKKYGDLVETRTQGKVKIELFPNAQLTGGNERTMVEQLMMGTQQMALFPTALAGDKWTVFGLPFLFPNRQKIYAICDGKLGQELLDMQESLGLKAVVFWENGFRQITNNKRPITKPEDMKGLKIRVPTVPQLLEAVKALGANPVPISKGELYMALSQGTVDGQENPLSNIYENKYYEVQKYLTVANYSWSPMTLAFNKSFYDRLPKDVQKVLYDAGREVASYARGLIEEEDKVLGKKLEEVGMKVTILAEGQLALFREATKGVVTTMEPIIGKDILKKFQDAVK
jgi:tripartite ATP-independent transporter DctP family solute receptor